MLFVLSSERSGSTLLTRMLGQHPAIIAPSELWFLRYEDFHGWNTEKPQALHSLAEIASSLGLPEDREALAAHFKDKETLAIYRELLARTPEASILVDKTPAYANELPILEKSRALDATYIWLLRHPLGVIASEIGHADKQLQENGRNTPLRRLRHAVQRKMNGGMTGRERRREEKWLLQNRNIEAFLKTVPESRQVRIVFEELLLHPEETLRALCQTLGIDFHSAMLDPFAGKSKIKPGLGNPNFHTRSRIETAPIHSWKGRYSPEFLSADTLGFMKHLAAPSWSC